MYLGVAKCACWKARLLEVATHAVSSEESSGNNPDNSGKFNLRERYPDNGDGKKGWLLHSGAAPLFPEKALRQ